VPKVPHETVLFGSSSNVVTRTNATVIQTHTAPNLASDTLARTLTQFHFAITIDPTGNPPPIEWWQAARLMLGLQYNQNGSAAATTNEDSPLLLARWMIYPEPFYDLTTNDLYGVRFTPRSDLLVTSTRRKGDGVNFAKLLWVLYLHDTNHALDNPGGAYSVNSSFAIYTKAIWESDT
jgi:hypothetical protein